MLAATQRLRRREDFAATIQGGRRAGRGGVVVHLRSDPHSKPDRAGLDGTSVARAGFVVSRAVGTAVVRNEVRRRLRHLMRERLVALPIGADLVVRALPSAADRAYADLGVDLDSALASAVGRRGRGQGAGRDAGRGGGREEPR